MFVVVAGTLLLWATLLFMAGGNCCFALNFTDNCTRGYYLYDTVNERQLEFYESSYLLNFFQGSGTINLAQLPNVSTSLSLVVDFCLSDLTYVVFDIYADSGPPQHHRYLQQIINATNSPFSTGGISANGTLRPSAWLNTPGNYFINTGGVGDGFGIAQAVTINVFWPQAGNVSSISLVDIDANRTAFLTVGAGDSVVVDLARYPTNHTYSAFANVGGRVSSVKFTIAGAPPKAKTLFSFIDNTLPFTMGGDLRGNYTVVKQLSSPGTYQLRATPFTRTRARGQAGWTYWSTLVVLPKYRVQNFTFVDLDTGAEYGIPITTTPPEPYPALSYIDVVPYNGTNLTVRANVVGNVGSIKFTLYRYRNVTIHRGIEAPSIDFANPVQVLKTFVNGFPFRRFGLGGLTKAGKFRPVTAFAAGGLYHLQAVAYPLANLKGTAQPPQNMYFGIRPVGPVI